MAWDIVSTVLSRSFHKTSSGSSSGTQNQLFRRSRLRLAVWYAGVMGTILTLLGCGVYGAIAHAHEVAIDSEIRSVASTLHDAIEVTISNPDQLNQLSPQLLPDFCLSDKPCIGPMTGPIRHLQQNYQYDYYIRIVDPVGSLLATGGIRPEGLPMSIASPALQSLRDNEGQEYTLDV